MLGNSYLVQKSPVYSTALGWCRHSNKSHYISLVVQERFLQKITPEIHVYIQLGFWPSQVSAWFIPAISGAKNVSWLFPYYLRTFIISFWVLSCLHQSYRPESVPGSLTLWIDLPSCHQILMSISWIEPVVLSTKFPCYYNPFVSWEFLFSWSVAVFPYALLLEPFMIVCDVPQVWLVSRLMV